MNPSGNQESERAIADLLADIRKKGVRLWSDDGELRYRAPKGALTRVELQRLRESGSEIVALLKQINHVPERALQERRRSDRVPLSFSQVSHWHFRRLGERPSVRQLACAIRLCGPLSIDLLRQSLVQIVRRQEALRIRFVVLDEGPEQFVTESDDSELTVTDLTALPEDVRETQVRNLIEQLILEPIDVTVGPLFSLRLAKLGEDEYVLMVAMEHLISDAVSLNILLTECFEVYRLALQGRQHSLPAIGLHFADYAVDQKNAQESWLEKHGRYWSERLAGCQRVQFPGRRTVPMIGQVGWGTVSLKIGGELKAELREWCRLRRTTLAMGVFTAYVALVLRWCDTADTVIRYQTDGRVSPKVENTIGYFASVLHLRIQSLGDDSFVDLLNRVTEEYCKAYEHADFSYIDAQVPAPEFTRNTTFNWVPHGPTANLPKIDGMTTCRFPYASPTLRISDKDSEPVVLFYDLDDEVLGGVHFPINLFGIETMEKFGQNFMAFLEKLLRQPEARLLDLRIQ
jgi:hypothetical protein